MYFVWTRTREEALRRANDVATQPDECNKLRSQGIAISFQDISTCIDVSIILLLYAYIIYFPYCKKSWQELLIIISMVYMFRYV
jgi:hypothetical protein